MKNMIHAVGLVGLLMFGQLAIASSETGAKQNRSPASADYLDPTEFQKLREDPVVKKSVEMSLDIFKKSGTLVVCSTPNDIDRTLALTFYGVPYRITQMVATGASAATNGKVCVVAVSAKALPGSWLPSLPDVDSGGVQPHIKSH